MRRSSRSGGRRAVSGGGRRSDADRGYDIVQLREWAGENKIKIPSRGRIPQDVVEQYKAAGGK